MQLATAQVNTDSRSNYGPLSKTSCLGCNRQHSCLSNLLAGQDLAAFDSIVKHSRKLNRGDFIFRAGDEFNMIYIIRSGSVKSVIIDEEGREQILDFSFRGDIIGLDGAFLPNHPTSAQALESSFVCAIPFARYLELAAEIPALYQKLLASMSNRILEEEEHALLLGTKHVDQRLATFLVNLSKRNSINGYSEDVLNLPMSRRDIGNYLSAAVETISRLFSRLQATQLIEVHGRQVRINDLEGLKKLAA